MSEAPEPPEVEGRTGAAIEEEIGQLSDELERQKPSSEQPPAAPPAQRRRLLNSPWLAAFLLVVVAALTAANITGFQLFKHDKAPFDPPRDPLRETLLFALEEIEEYREVQGRLPSRLGDVEMAEGAGLTYILDGENAFTLTATDGSQSLTFSSIQDPGTFFGELWTGP